jgi:adenylate kinase
MFKMLRLIFFGPPGSGKGTYASILAPKLGIAKISTGDIFREAIEAKTELGKKVEEYIKRGELVPDEITIDVLKEKINSPDAKNGFILDGYPRTIHQAEVLDKITTIDAIVNLVVPEWVIIERLSTRRICKKCGAIYNIRYLKPKLEGICDKCGCELYQREDDKPEVIKERLKVYERQTQPLLDYYKNRTVINIECNDVDVPPETVANKIMERLQQLGLI